MPYSLAYRATAAHWSRRFWQGSHDHRGTINAPGRVLTLVSMKGEHCIGRVFGIPQSHVDTTLTQLDYREKNGYERQTLIIDTAELGELEALTYIAPRGNQAWLGDASNQAIADLIRTAQGPSGTNTDYVLSLHDALVADSIRDDHISEIAALLR
ncbi:UNVERIFIED_CONTAM: hypothetical protein GTU68_008686 [Idotea baltica]|nr:hypothetical protein [Idotea baltica]